MSGWKNFNFNSVITNLYIGWSNFFPGISANDLAISHLSHDSIKIKELVPPIVKKTFSLC